MELEISLHVRKSPPLEPILKRFLVKNLSILWKFEINYHILKTPPVDLALSQINLKHILALYLFTVNISLTFAPLHRC
jgi:hypothetical protein